MWIRYSSSPTALLENTPAPTTPKMKAGPQLLQKASRRSASSREIMRFSYRAMAVLAPTG